MAYEIDVNALPFSEDKQNAIVGYLLFDHEEVPFYVGVVSKVEPSWFINEVPRQVFTYIKKRYQLTGERVSSKQVLESPDVMKLANGLQQQIHVGVSLMSSARKLYNIKALTDELEAWLKARIITRALPEAGTAFNNGNIEGSASILSNMVKEYYEAKFEGDGVQKFKGYRNEMIAEEMDRNRAMTFGIEKMDRLIDPDGAAGTGSLFRGDMTIFLAPTNVGKTSAMVTVLMENIRRGKSVLFITHEGNPKEIKSKVMRCAHKLTRPDLRRAYDNMDLQPRMERMESIIDHLLTYLPMNKPGLSVEEVAAQIDKLQMARKSTTGKYYDLIVDDYPAKLTTELARGGYFQLRHIHEEVYNQFVQIALKYDAHVLCAIQTNRDGSRVNRKTGIYRNETRLLQMEDVMEAWGPMTAASTVISMNRDSQDAATNKLTYLICKSRSGDTDWALVCNTDYKKCILHSEDLGYFWYRGDDGLSNRSAELMNAWKGKEIPEDKLRPPAA